MNGVNAPLFPTRVQSPARRRPILRSKSAAPKKKDTHVGVFLFWSGRRGSTRYRHPTNGRAIRRSPAGPLDLTRFAPVEAASSSLPAAFQKENTILTDGVSFCDYPQVLLFAPSHIARKGECEGETFAGFPARVQSPARRRPILRSKIAAPKKKRHTFVCLFFFGAGDEARTRYLDLGKVALYQMSYARRRHHYCSAYGASGRGRTGDTRIFSPLLYQLSYRGIWRPRRGSNPRPPA